MRLLAHWCSAPCQECAHAPSQSSSSHFCPDAFINKTPATFHVLSSCHAAPTFMPRGLACLKTRYHLKEILRVFFCMVTMIDACPEISSVAKPNGGQCYKSLGLGGLRVKAHIDHRAGQMLASISHLLRHFFICSIWRGGRGRGRNLLPNNRGHLPGDEQREAGGHISWW